MINFIAFSSLEYAAKITESLSAVALLPDPAAERVRYPRTPGYRPTPEENPHNAWYDSDGDDTLFWKINILKITNELIQKKTDNQESD